MLTSLDLKREEQKIISLSLIYTLQRRCSLKRADLQANRPVAVSLQIPSFRKAAQSCHGAQINHLVAPFLARHYTAGYPPINRVLHPRNYLIRLPSWCCLSLSHRECTLLFARACHDLNKKSFNCFLVYFLLW